MERFVLHSNYTDVMGLVSNIYPCSFVSNSFLDFLVSLQTYFSDKLITKGIDQNIVSYPTCVLLFWLRVWKSTGPFIDGLNKDGRENVE